MILNDLKASTAKKLRQRKTRVSLAELKRQCASLPAGDGLQRLIADLQQPALSIIAEIKQASPSKGLIVSQLPYLQIAQAYEKAQVSAISVLTEEDHFKGRLQYLKEIAAQTKIPILRKDFTIDPYMIYEAKAAGASIILLITAILTDQQLNADLALAEQLNLAAIVEVHQQQELQRALKSSAKIIGINNRNLTNFKVDLQTTVKLSPQIPADRLVIAESGIHSAADVAFLQKNARINGVLIGEYLMRSANKTAVIKELKQTAND
jgi:indole-3-glycerol phosphate synthase